MTQGVPIGTMMVWIGGEPYPDGWYPCANDSRLNAEAFPVLDTLLPFRRPPRRWWQWPKRKRRPYGGDEHQIGLPNFAAPTLSVPTFSGGRVVDVPQTHVFIIKAREAGS